MTDEALTPTTPQPPPSGDRQTIALGYRGEVGEIWRLALVTTLLTVVTLGVYRFWAKTRMRRYFWSRLTLNGEPLEYTGTGLEMFLGFLIASLAIGAFYMVLVLAGLAAGESLIVGIVIQIVSVVFILAIIPIAIFSARRYRLSRTVWRGVRAGQTGRRRDYWKLAFGYGLIGFITLGLLRPLAHARLNSYLMNNTWFGTGQCQFEVSARELLRRWLWPWGLIALAVVLQLGGFRWLMHAVAPEGQMAPDPNAEFLELLTTNPMVGISIAVVALIYIAAGVAFLGYRVFMARRFTAATTFDGLSFVSRLRFWRVFGVIACFYVGVAVLFGLAVALGMIFGEQFIPIAMIVLALLAGSLIAPFLVHPLLRHYVETLEIQGTVDFAAIAQNPDAGPTTGEGLASALDVDAF